MATPEQEEVVGEEEQEDIGYKVPEKKSVDEILNADQEDESLRKYKETLLGSAVKEINLFPGKPEVVMDSMTLLLADNTEVGTINLQAGSKSDMKKTFTLAEKAEFKVKLDFYVQGKEIVTGLKYKQVTYKGIIPVAVDKSNHMLGSYPPKEDIISVTSSTDEAPAGMMARGTYKIKSSVIDDDKKEYFKWEWNLEIKSAK